MADALAPAIAGQMTQTYFNFPHSQSANFFFAYTQSAVIFPHTQRRPLLVLYASAKAFTTAQSLFTNARSLFTNSRSLFTNPQTSSRISKGLCAFANVNFFFAKAQSQNFRVCNSATCRWMQWQYMQWLRFGIGICALTIGRLAFLKILFQALTGRVQKTVVSTRACVSVRSLQSLDRPNL